MVTLSKYMSEHWASILKRQDTDIETVMNEYFVMARRINLSASKAIMKKLIPRDIENED